MPRATPAAPTATAALEVTFTRRADGAVVFRCTRADGTATWQRHEGPRAHFFSFHDLTHFAVESVLGFRRGFYGLIAEGWDIDDTGGKGKRGPLPREAVTVEHLVGLIDRERIGGAAPFTAATLAAQLRELVAQGTLDAVPDVDEAALGAVRRRIEELHARWAAVAPGETMTLRFGHEPA